MFDILKKIYTLLSRQRQKQLLWLTVGMFAMSFVELTLAGAVSLLGVALAAPESLEKIGPLWALFHALPSLGENIPQSIRMLIMVMAMVCVATALKNILTAGMTYWQGLVSQAVAWDVGTRIFDNYLHAPYVWHTQQNPAELSGYLGWRNYVSGFFMAALQVGSQFGIMLFLMAGAFFMAPLISLLLYGISALTALITYKCAQRKARETGEITSQLGLSSNRVALAALLGIREVQIYGQQVAFDRQYRAFAAPSARATALQSLYTPMPYWLLESVGMLLLLAAVLLMAFRGDSIAATSGVLTLMAAISWRLLPALNKVVGGVLLLKANHTPVQTLLHSHLCMPRVQGAPLQLKFSHQLELKSITFQYPEAKREALQQVDLTIAKGSMVGLVGLSGAGKSTLVGILTGLLTPSGGRILLDGKDISSSPGFLNVGYVPQNPYIVDASLAENVAFTDWGEAIDEERVRKCCRMAAMDFLDSLSDDIYTVLGEHGVRLSGGQVQRVAIARALYNAPDILLFDEATSALDSAAEASIQQTVVALGKNMTVIMVAHRLSTVRQCDMVYWIDGGHVRTQGKPEEALQEYEEYMRSLATAGESAHGRG